MEQHYSQLLQGLKKTETTAEESNLWATSRMSERIIEQRIKNRIRQDEMQFGSVERRTTDVIFLVRRLQEQYLAESEPLHLVFIDLVKSFDRVSCSVAWRPLKTLGVDEWLVRAG